MVKYDNILKCKVYPICRFDDNQHRLDWHITKLESDMLEKLMNGQVDESDDVKLKHLQELMTLFLGGVCSDGLVYMPWKAGQEVKELIAAYNATHAY